MKYSQGDVRIKTITNLPKGVKKFNHLVLAHGESGHTHQVVNGQAELLQAGELMYLIVKSKTAEIGHEEHGNIILPKGYYAVTRVREYDYDTQEARQVLD